MTTGVADGLALGVADGLAVAEAIGVGAGVPVATLIAGICDSLKKSADSIFPIVVVSKDGVMEVEISLDTLGLGAVVKAR